MQVYKSELRKSHEPRRELSESHGPPASEETLAFFSARINFVACTRHTFNFIIYSRTLTATWQVIHVSQ